MSELAALGFRAHSGWAAAVAVAGTQEHPIIVDRHRIVTADPAIPGSRQPYHAAERLGLDQAEPLLCQCRDSSRLLALHAVSAMVTQLNRENFTVAGSGIVFASGRALPELATILRSHALIHTAEGEFFREILVHASEHCSLLVTRINERELRDEVKVLNALGKSIGPPWTQDQKLASLAAFVAIQRSR